MDGTDPPKPAQAAPVAIVRGGTTTSAYDTYVARMRHEAEARRAELDEEKKIAATPIEAGGGLMYSGQFGSDEHHPKILLEYMGARHPDMRWQLCELVKDDGTGDWMLIFVCPACVERGIPQDQAQCHVRKGHRAWHLDERTATKNTGKPGECRVGGMKQYFVSAGEIVDTDVFRCDNVNCTFACRIDRNRMYRA